ncbi:Pre-mRNA-splicing factor of RES complex-domain-containing protein [Tuber brumale]|nr:Pre-mRNA-splicing factor of RES complex-domain-containing protein [Tuber brumale]
MSRAEYLQKYLTKDDSTKKKAKKRKRKDAGVIVADDDVPGWNNNNEDGDEDDPVTIGEMTKAFRRTTKSNWTTKPEDPEDQPAIVEEEDEKPATIQKMSSGAHAGLQTAAQVAAQLERQRKAEAARFAVEDPEISGRGQETIYRDASGRIINVAMARAEARKKLEEEEAKQRKLEEHLKGDVQLVQKAERKKELEDAKYAPMARYADDKELNEELRERDRWNDPAMAFLSSKKKGVSKTGRPLYQGAAPPNRYGILPGHRWDGVDRGNGWEKKWFQAQNTRKNRAQIEHDMEIDV